MYVFYRVPQSWKWTKTRMLERYVELRKCYHLSLKKDLGKKENSHFTGPLYSFQEVLGLLEGGPVSLLRDKPPGSRQCAPFPALTPGWGRRRWRSDPWLYSLHKGEWLLGNPTKGIKRTYKLPLGLFRHTNSFQHYKVAVQGEKPTMKRWFAVSRLEEISERTERIQAAKKSFLCWVAGRTSDEELDHLGGAQSRPLLHTDRSQLKWLGHLFHMSHQEEAPEKTQDRMERCLSTGLGTPGYSPGRAVQGV